MLFVVVKSLAVLLTVSVVVAFSITHNLYDFFRIFIAATFAQFIIYGCYRRVVRWIDTKLENERLKEFTKQGKEVQCPCPRALKHFIPIQLDIDNSYRCQDCKRGVIVDVEVKTFLESDMMSIPKADAAIVSSIIETTSAVK